MRIRIKIEYDGTGYGGWQIQPNADTVQEQIEAALHSVTGEKIRIHGSGRTDAGVHAMCQTAHFDICNIGSIPPKRFAYALNAHLPYDIRILNSQEVGGDFHSRYSARGKKYMYLICNAPQASALYRNMSMHVPRGLDEDAMREGASCLVGEHDFVSFCSIHTDAKDTVRTINDISIVRAGDYIRIEVTGNGFLRSMVRIIAGTLIDVGLGKTTPLYVEKILAARERTLAGATAQARGLYLVEVYYDEIAQKY